MKFRAISETFSWLQDTVYESAIILTDSMSTLEKIRKACLHAEWKRAIEQSKLTRVVWIFCPGHAGVRGNERADELAGQAALGDNPKIGQATVIAIV